MENDRYIVLKQIKGQEGDVNVGDILTSKLIKGFMVLYNDDNKRVCYVDSKVGKNRCRKL